MLNRQWFAERPYVIAIIIALLLVLWMASGIGQDNKLQTNIEGNSSSVVAETSKKAQQAPIPKVKVETRMAVPVFDTVELYGRTEPDRTATLKAEVDGKIVEVLAKRGATVKQGDVIARIAINDLQARLTEAKALRAQREIEHQGATKLHKDGYQGRAQLARAVAELEAVKATIQRLEIDIANTVIRAPFDGVMNTRYVEQGDYVKDGDQIAMIADLDPLIVRAHATENQITQLQTGQVAHIELLSHQQADGEIRYIASVADDATNTFKIEVAIENADNQLLAGMSGEVTLPLAEVDAIKVSPALLALDEQGNIGIKTVVDNQVVFTGINIVKSESDGIWLTGLGKQADIIVLGQGFVRAGDMVEAVFDTAQALAQQSSDMNKG
ncbi:efflux RND transporter periplasmic adaptor subunit [Thalassotalea montiporae]